MEIKASTEVTIRMTIKGEELDKIILLISSGIYYKEDIIKQLSSKSTGSKIDENFNDGIINSHRADIEFGQEFVRKIKLSR